MEQVLLSPQLIIEVSWEVCNKVGGIYTVLSTRAKSLQMGHKDKVIFVGPDLCDENPLFQEDKSLLKEWRLKAQSDGLYIRVGRWAVPGSPIAILVGFNDYYHRLPMLFAKMWEKYKVESHAAYGDYEEACAFAFASAEVIENLLDYNQLGVPKDSTVVHFNEWTTGMGALHLQLTQPKVATMFTTHATSIGRSICGNNKPLYGSLSEYNGDQMARELNMVSKHSLEKCTAHAVDAFTTVSAITAKECEALLDKKVDVVLPNGFEPSFVPQEELYNQSRIAARENMLRVASRLTGCDYIDQQTMIVVNSGRYEFRNKGVDLFVDSVNRLRTMDIPNNKRVIAFVMVPADSAGAREDLKEYLDSEIELKGLPNPIVTHNLNNIHLDRLMNQMQWLGMHNHPDERVHLIFVPVYLNGEDGIFNLTYYQLIPGFDLTIFPSYYEPWGYTPLESIAFGVPTVTTNLAGFGLWASTQVDTTSIEYGVEVINRDDSNEVEVSMKMADLMKQYAMKSQEECSLIRQRSVDCAKLADWAHFIKYYYQAYSVAIKRARNRVGGLNTSIRQ
ncbi:MAG: glycogen/starch synthase [Bacteroidales bacterium]